MARVAGRMGCTVCRIRGCEQEKGNDHGEVFDVGAEAGRWRLGIGPAAGWMRRGVSERAACPGGRKAVNMLNLLAPNTNSAIHV